MAKHSNAAMMRLLVLGPGFNLPSIDAHCLAAIAFLCLHRADLTCSIIPTHDTRDALPVLLENNTRISGFRNIVRHLSNIHFSPPTTPLTPIQQADSTALSSFLTTHAQLLLDITIYVSLENYTHATRSAFTALLPWHANYILPPQLRAAARKRTQRLGIDSLDVANVHDDLSNRPEGFDGVGKAPQEGFEVDAQKRASLLLPRRNTVGSLLLQRAPEHKAVFKLHALAEHFFTPLSGLLDDGRAFLLGEELTSLDCEAFAYLALMLYPRLPQDWLARILRRKFAVLIAYTERVREKLGLNEDVDVKGVMSLAKCKTQEEVVARRKACGLMLPWDLPARSTLGEVLQTTALEILGLVPLIGPSRTVIVRSSSHLSRTSRYRNPSWLQSYLPLISASAATSLALGVYGSLATGVLLWPKGEEVQMFGRRRLRDYGHLAAALGSASLSRAGAG